MAYANIQDARAASARDYLANKQEYIDRSTRRKQRLYAEVVVPAKSKPCMDCGNSFPVVCMDFDHVRGEKLFDIATGYKLVSLRLLLEEILKCDVVCANCHRIRTSQRI